MDKYFQLKAQRDSFTTLTGVRLSRLHRLGPAVAGFIRAVDLTRKIANERLYDTNSAISTIKETFKQTNADKVVEALFEGAERKKLQLAILALADGTATTEQQIGAAALLNLMLFPSSSDHPEEETFNALTTGAAFLGVSLDEKDFEDDNSEIPDDVSTFFNNDPDDDTFDDTDDQGDDSDVDFGDFDDPEELKKAEDATPLPADTVPESTETKQSSEPNTIPGSETAHVHSAPSSNDTGSSSDSSSSDSSGSGSSDY